MQNKGLIRVFAILFGLVSIYQLSFTYITNKVEKEAQTFAETQITVSEENYISKREATIKKYLDSVTSVPVIMGVTYSDAKEKELNRGLDLKGGINVILQISAKDILLNLSNNSKDPAFNKALDEAHTIQKTSSLNYLDAFMQAYEAIPGDNKLASPNVFFNKNTEGEINPNMTNAQVKAVISKKLDESVEAALEVIRKRIDKFSVTQPNIQRLGTSARILVELPGAKEIDRVKGLLENTAQLEFWHVYRIDEMESFLMNANSYLKTLQTAETSTQNTDTQEEETGNENTEENNDPISDIEKLLGGQNVTDSLNNQLEENPLFDKMVRYGYPGGPVLGTFRVQDTAAINQYLKMPQVRNLLPAQQRYTKFVWGKEVVDTELQEKTTDLYALKYTRDGVPQLGGDVVTDARHDFSMGGAPVVSMQMNAKGARIWEEMTGLAFNQKSQIAIVLDDVVYSAPGVTSGPISGGSSQITGNFSVNEAIDLANVLKAGKLPAKAQIIQSEVVGPSLGQEAIKSGTYSFIFAFFLIMIWMIGYYGKAGWFANVALIVNILFIFGILAGMGAVLTLPGIAGIILTLAMAIDANVLIFERIREEYDKGKLQKEAINDGFKNALSSILDANITSAFIGIILLMFGTGPIQGFATTLLIGIATSLFTAIFITRLFIDKYVYSEKRLSFATPLTKNLFKNFNIDFIGKRKIAYVVSGILIAVSLFSIFTNGFNLGVDFVGGRTYTVRFDKPMVASEVQKSLVEEFGSAEAKTFGSPNQLKITTKYKIDEQSSEVDNEVQELLFQALNPYLPAGFSYDDFTNADDNKNIGVMQSIKVGPTIASNLKVAAYWSIFGSLLVMFLYILARFRGWQFSLGAVVGLVHDSIIILGIFSLLRNIMPFSMEVDQAFIAAILTAIGYSINDTVVVFDRIREYYINNPSWTFLKKVNDSLNSTISRTINTSLSTLLVLIVMFVFGADSLRGFIFALIIGVVVGVYSTLYIATPIMYDTAKNTGLKLKTKEDNEEPVSQVS